ncbi:MAG TPA: hypothetical protein VGB77_13440 [Abditibacteriaceae bacterium]|jgi:hypothetical protein
MSREITPDAIVIEGKTIPFADLMPLKEAAEVAGVSTTRIYVQLRSVKIFNARVFIRSEVEALRDEVNAGREPQEEKVAA